VKALVVALVLAVSPVQFLQAHSTNGAFAEPNGMPNPSLTSWAVLGLTAAGVDSPGSLTYLQSQETNLSSVTDVALVALAEQALGGHPTALLDLLRNARLPNGQIGPTVNATCWAVLALGSSTRTTTRWLLAQQAKNGGFSWAIHGQPDSNDTAAALEALRVARVTGIPIKRAVKFLLSFQNRDGGFELTRGRGSDAQSTAWAIQGLVAAGRTPPRSAFTYLAKLRQTDGSYRYSVRYAVTPVWVTSQVLAAVEKKPFPLGR
jgi:prenyltransferase beta subunit